MTYAERISPTDIRDYAKLHGWAPVPEAVQDRLFVLNYPSIDLMQIVVPMDADRPDFDAAVRIAIERLATVEAHPFQTIETSLMEAGADTLRFGVTTQRQLEDGLPLGYAVRAIKGVENVLRAAACSEVQPQPFHPKMKRTEAQKLVEASQLRHTELGSFVIKVACPIDAIATDESNTPEQKLPFVRRATIGLSEAILGLVGALEADTLGDFVTNARHSGASHLSSNLCDGLLAFQETNLRANLDFSVAWSARLVSPAAPLRRKTRIQWDYFPRIEQVRTALRPDIAPHRETFYGIVDELKGDVRPDGQREGEVTLDLLVDGESIKAKANLTAGQHDVTHKFVYSSL